MLVNLKTDPVLSAPYRSMVRIPRRAKIIAFSGVPCEISSSSETDERQSLADRAREKMVEKEVASSGVVTERQVVKSNYWEASNHVPGGYLAGQ